MDIGKEDSPYTIEPIEDPVPGRRREIIPDEMPDLTPVVEPERELVPA